MSRNASCQCTVVVPHKRVFPGALVEGYATLAIAHDLAVRNVHVKVAGIEKVLAMVDQVDEAKVAGLPFGTVSQDFVYYREIVTLAGDLLTRPRVSPATPPLSHGHASESPAPTGSHTQADEVCYQETHLANNSSDPATHRSSVFISLEAAANREDVVIPAGSYRYPFAFQLPDELPPSYETSVHVKNGTQSTSRAQLVYYAKLYLIGPDGREVATARDDFTVLPMQPLQPNRTFIGCMQRRLRDEGTTVEVLFPAAGSACGALCGGGSSEANGKSKKNNNSHQLAARIALASNWLKLGKDKLKVELSLFNKTAKPIQGARVTLVQQLTFRTSKADVVTTCQLLTAESHTPVACGQNGVITVVSEALPAASDDVIPTLSTSGLVVQYNLRVELLARHLVDGTYTFEAVVLTGSEDAEIGEPPCGEMAFSALPRGHLTRREAYYAVPQNPCTTPELAALRVTSP